MIIDNNNGAAMASGSVFPDGDALAEELQLQEVILFYAFQEMVLRGHISDQLIPCSTICSGKTAQNHQKGPPPLLILGNPRHRRPAINSTAQFAWKVCPAVAS